MRDDFDSVVADRFKVLDDVTVPDTWSRVLDRVPGSDPWSRVEFNDEGVTMLELEPPVPTALRRRSLRRVGVAMLVVAAAVIAIVLVVSHDRHDGAPADQPGTTVTMTPRALFGTQDEQLAPGTYFIDEVDGTPTPRIFVTIGAGWTNTFDREGITNDAGFISFTRPDQVYLDACNERNGAHPGPLTTPQGLATALFEQRGWGDVTSPSDISVDGYAGKTFQRTAPVDLRDCSNATPAHTRVPGLSGSLKSWQNEQSSNFAGSYYEPLQFENLMVLDIDGTLVVINANLWPESSAADRPEFAAVLDSIRIERG